MTNISLDLLIIEVQISDFLLKTQRFQVFLFQFSLEFLLFELLFVFIEDFLHFAYRFRDFRGSEAFLQIRSIEEFGISGCKNRLFVRCREFQFLGLKRDDVIIVISRFRAFFLIDGIRYIPGS